MKAKVKIIPVECCTVHVEAKIFRLLPDKSSWKPSQIFFTIYATANQDDEGWYELIELAFVLGSETLVLSCTVINSAINFKLVIELLLGLTANITRTDLLCSSYSRLTGAWETCKTRVHTLVFQLSSSLIFMINSKAFGYFDHCARWFVCNYCNLISFFCVITVYLLY